jgi:hypothetical protein
MINTTTKNAGWFTYVSKGDGTFKKTGSLTPYPQWHSPTTGDYNGDGLTDVIINTTTSNAGWFIYVSKGDGTFKKRGALTRYPQWHSAVPIDLNGDGYDGVLINTATSGAGWFYYDNKNNLNENPRDVVVNFAGGLGSSSKLELGNFLSDSIYTKGTGSVYPEVDIQGPMYVVSKVTVDDGVGGTRDTTYRYEGLKSSYLRGSLGFKSMTATDVLTGIETRTEYSQSYPYVGQVIKSTETYNNQTASAADDVLLSELTNSYQQIQTHTGVETVSGHSGVLFPYANNVVKKSYELNTGALISTVTTEQFYDSYGNPTQIDVTTEGNNAQGISESFKTTTNNSYTNDTANWYLGRLTRTDVTNTLPDNSSQSRSSAFEYDPNTGLLTKEIIEPDTAAIRLITEYEYDAFGNKTKVTVSGGQ